MIPGVTDYVSADSSHLQDETIREAQRLVARGLHLDAARVLSDFLRNNPTDIRAHRELAKVRFAQGQTDWGQSLLRRARWLEDQARSLQPAPSADEPFDPDLEWADMVESSLMAEAEEFSVWEHDAPPVPKGGISGNWQSPRDVEERESPVTPQASDTGLDANTDAPAEQSDSSAPQPLLSLGKRADDEANSERPQEGEKLGPVIVWKGRRRVGITKPPPSDENDVTPAAIDIPPSLEVETSESESFDAIEGDADDEIEYAVFTNANDGAGDDDYNHGESGAVDEPYDDADSDVDDDVALWESFEGKTYTESTCGDDDFNWNEIDVVFDDDEYVEEASQPVDKPGGDDSDEAAGFIALWHYTEKVALNVLREAGRLEDRWRAREEVRIISRILLEGAAGTNRPEISVSVRSRHLGRFLSDGVSLDDLAAAHACRQAWAEQPEFHLELAGRKRGDSWMRHEGSKPLFPWKLALRMVEVFEVTDVEEFRFVFFTLYERWHERRVLQRQFPMFIYYVYFRLHPSGLLLDLMPLCVFDEPEGIDELDLWEDDPVRRTYFNQELRSWGLVPDLYRTSLNLPSRNMYED